MNIFQRMESNVRSYCRSFPTVFTRAKDHLLFDEQGRAFIDFFAGAGSLNYGHNNDVLKSALIEYLSSDGVTHALDMSTAAKRDLLQTMQDVLLAPRGLDYKVMFPGPTGTNAVESALKLARKVTGRSNVIAFTNGFHGMTLGSLALTGNAGKRAGAGVALSDTMHMPFCDYFDADTDTISLVESYLSDNSSGIEAPAAFIVETVQAEGGVNVASKQWLQRLAALANKVGALLIIDDIQVGCGRTGPFFSFEFAGIKPDILCLSKSLSGYGLPFALTLMKPEIDAFQPGEHNGTFRGHNPAFVTATAALRHYWQDDQLSQDVNRKAKKIKATLLDLAETYGADVRGRGLIQGIQFHEEDVASVISRAAYDRGLIIETAGPNDEVVKTLPPLTIAEDALDNGLKILVDSVREVLGAAHGKKGRTLATAD
ncbi:diaminobutyrate--2-oxoglutarate transaminase [Blastopirellula retiformator]|uniref:Diaminobutyrate--2-oxoglutarate transaminase n=1 Tax=Blastopirellula retiformator TaxID=2527970 RepID=A0A5C5VB15_9BACT|nr:diaminobutyrate--2-oxoglutarate transaminase [Blastopirellula retiformator]TWT34882.1 Diaminobutyrate--2-oxoglutarate transaminase [Blastopirellula retiformator]